MEAAAGLGGLSAGTAASLLPDFAWQQLPAPPANALEAAAADPASAAALAALESVINNAPPLEGVTGRRDMLLPWQEHASSKPPATG